MSEGEGRRVRAREGEPGKARGKALGHLPSRDHQVDKLLVLVVHLVRADAMREERVLRREAARVERARDLLVEVAREQRRREVGALCLLRPPLDVQATEGLLRPRVCSTRASRQSAQSVQISPISPIGMQSEVSVPTHSAPPEQRARDVSISRGAAKAPSERYAVSISIMALLRRRDRGTVLAHTPPST